MAYSEELATKVRTALKAHKNNLEEKKMMGGLTFMLNGKMCCGILKDDLMLRISPEQYEDALKRPHAREMDFTGRPMKGFVFVAPRGYESAKDLKYWVNLAVDYNEILKKAPVKKKPKKKKASTKNN
jgi:TfoX/Sxy family transcriptional regulator of competence genes